jgi:hypothetical protein
MTPQAGLAGLAGDASAIRGGRRHAGRRRDGNRLFTIPGKSRPMGRPADGKCRHRAVPP